jgi:hypothetical protein
MVNAADASSVPAENRAGGHERRLVELIACPKFGSWFMAAAGACQIGYFFYPFIERRPGSSQGANA